MDPNIKREIILDNFNNPYNKVNEEIDGYLYANSNNESCIDNIDIYVDIKDDVIKDIKFKGEACAISTASTSIMIKNMIGMNIDDAISYINNFENMIDDKEYDDNHFNDAVVFDETYKQGSRHTCVTLPYRGIRKILERYKDGKEGK